MIIAVDFDGTIVEHRYPQIGKEMPFAIATLKQLQAERHLLILWSVREGKLLEEAVELPDWGAIYEMIHNRWSYERYLNQMHGIEKTEKASFWKRIFG